MQIIKDKKNSQKDNKAKTVVLVTKNERGAVNE